MQWKKNLWYSLTIFLLGFLVFYIGYSSYVIVQQLSSFLPNWKAVLGILLNFLILLLELLSTFYSILICGIIQISPEGKAQTNLSCYWPAIALLLGCYCAAIAP